ncbi:MAG: type IV secretion system protein [Sphingomonas sp.]|uniref:type IV secretion system protein n=1 Tax=Sphingomonas sp. TaxID=28214 RepID=UPI001830F10A|nr:type IV secretion system protein [Sphingomonas sp.]MBA3667381.1 type IV secretion system protein [Sphingomonas sp.]
MPTFCTAAASDRFAARLLADTDCQAFGMVERGYAALSQPGGTVSTALTGLMVIAVAFFGYRLLLGRGIALRDALDLTVKIGVVLLIATSWESWQALAYQGVAQAPTQVAGEMLTGIGSPPPLDSLQRTLDALANAAVGYRTRAGIASPLVGGPAAAAAVLNLSAIVLTLSTVGLLVAARVVQAILLAIAPAMAGFLLFNGTRGMAQGWIGAIVGAALAPLFVLLVAAVEFAVLTPMIERLLAEQASGVFENSSVMPIGLVAVVFVFAIAFALKAAARMGNGIRLAQRRSADPAEREASAERISTDRQREVAAAQPALRIVQALEQIARRDAPRSTSQLRTIAGGRASGTARDSGGTAAPSSSATPPLPSLRATTRMRSAPRRSRAASRRDQ